MVIDTGTGGFDPGGSGPGLDVFQPSPPNDPATQPPAPNQPAVPDSLEPPRNPVLPEAPLPRPDPSDAPPDPTNGSGSGPDGSGAPSTTVPVSGGDGSTTVPGATRAPGSPDSVVATAGDAVVSVDWAPPLDTGGGPLTGYTVTLVPGGSSAQLDGSAKHHEFTSGIANGTTYTVSVSASNSVGSGQSALSNPVTPQAGLPDPPTSVTAVAGDGQISVTWAAANGNGTPIAEYIVTANGGSPETVTGTSATLDSLTNGVAYTVAVQARNTNGDLSTPAVAPGTYTPAGPPGPVTNLVVTPGINQLTVTWNPASSGGAPDAVVYDVNVGGDTRQVSTTTHTRTGLSAGTPYSVTVTPRTTKGTGTPSPPVTGTPLQQVSAPTLSNGSTTRPDQASIRFGATVNWNGDPSYNCWGKLFAKDDPAASWYQVAGVPSVSCTGSTIYTTGGSLTAHHIYKLELHVQNSAGTNYAISQEVTLAAPPAFAGINAVYQEPNHVFRVWIDVDWGASTTRQCSAVLEGWNGTAFQYLHPIAVDMSTCATQYLGNNVWRGYVVAEIGDANCWAPNNYRVKVWVANGAGNPEILSNQFRCG
jgi:hypothetical protein